VKVSAENALQVYMKLFVCMFLSSAVMAKRCEAFDIQNDCGAQAGGLWACGIAGTPCKGKA
jgi:hypothetical protein